MNKIYTLIDASGSMGEVDKKTLLKYLYIAIKNLMKYEFPDSEILYYSINDSINQILSIKDFEFKGDINENELNDFLNREGIKNILFITDGYFETKIKEYFKDAIKNKRVRASVIGLGDDCDNSKLSATFNKSNVYETFDISTCLKKLLVYK